jgi:hypothetical protein
MRSHPHRLTFATNFNLADKFSLIQIANRLSTLSAIYCAILQSVGRIPELESFVLSQNGKAPRNSPFFAVADEDMIGSKVINPLEKPKTQLPVNFTPNYCSFLIEHHKIKSFQQQRSVKTPY